MSIAILSLVLSFIFGYLYWDRQVSVNHEKNILAERIAKQQEEERRLKILEEENRTYWKCKAGEIFQCEPNINYTFKCFYNLNIIIINGIVHKIRSTSIFNIKFKEATKIALYNDVYAYDYEVFKNKTEGLKIIIINPNNYNDFDTLEVNKGMYLELLESNEICIVGYFINGLLKEDKLIEPHYYSSHYLYFFDTYQIKFKAAEVPSLLLLNAPEKEKLIVNDVPVNDAYYLVDGEIIKTNIWLDQGDDVFVETGNFELSADKENWIKHDSKFNWDKDSFLYIKAVGYTRINKIEIRRNKSWEFKLKKDAINKIRAYTGDELQYWSNFRYFLNGDMKEAHERYIYHSESDCYLEFKGSYGEGTIRVNVIKRRGF